MSPSKAAPGTGRYAPSPSGELHVGNLRTALIAYLAARASGRRFVIRIEDLDTGRSSVAAAEHQLADLAALGVRSDDEPIWQSDRHLAYRQAIAQLDDQGLVYECFCSRRDIREAASAAHGDGGLAGRYPGTCRNLSESEREQRRSEKTPNLRLRAQVDHLTIMDEVVGEFVGVVDDFVLRRGGDGDYAYNLAVVVDDAFQGVDQVVRGDDLLPSTPRQAYLAQTLGLPRPNYLHVPLVHGTDGARLAKRDGAVTLSQLRRQGRTVAEVREQLLRSIGISERDADRGLDQLAASFLLDRLPREPWEFPS